MHVVKLLHKIIGKSCQIDKRIIQALSEAAVALTVCRKLSIASIGRSLQRAAKVKHLIKCIDRLFGNKTLHNKKDDIYKAMITWLVKSNSHPVIVVDWSGLTQCGEYNFLRAAMTVRGRTITLYEQSFHVSKYGSNKAHIKFLKALQSLLPQDCIPVIVTDAGFRNSWFRLVSMMGSSLESLPDL